MRLQAHARSVFMALAALAAGSASQLPELLAQTPSVATATADTAPIVNRVRLSGTVVSPRTAQLSSDVGALVDTVLVDIGDRVDAGEPVVELDSALYQLRYESAQAQTREAEGELADAQRRVRIAERLASNNNLPQNELDAREAALRIAEAKVDRLEAEERRWRERVRRHTIAAPFAGVITRRVAEAGEWVDTGDTMLELVDVDHLRVDAPVSQRYFPQVADDTEVTLRFDALPDREVDAEVIARVPLSDPTARTFTVRLKPDTDDVALTPGMSANVLMRLGTGEEGVVIPRDAVIRYPDGRTTVWVTESEGDNVTVSERQVELGRAFDGRIHVRGGLEAGADVVVRGNESLEPGQQVTVSDGGS